MQFGSPFRPWQLNFHWYWVIPIDIEFPKPLEQDLHFNDGWGEPAQYVKSFGEKLAFVLLWCCNSLVLLL